MENAILPRILIVDDNPAIHDDFRKILDSQVGTDINLDTALASVLGTIAEKPLNELPVYKIDSAYQGQEGVEYVRAALNTKEPYALAFIDVRMPPGLDGIETIQHVWKIDGNIQIVICSAYSDYSWAETIEKLGQTDRLLILKKPFDNIEIRQIVCALIKKWQLNEENNFYIHNLEKLINERTAALKATIESTTDGILVVDCNNKVMNYNQNFLDMWKIPATLVLHNPLEQVLDFITAQFKYPEKFKQELEEIFDNSTLEKFDVIECTAGRIFEYYSKPQRTERNIIGRVYSFRNITHRKNLEAQLEHQATHDLLTGLPNRMLLIDRLQQAIASSKRFNTLVAVLFCDLDRFKQLNDGFGHCFGDQILQVIATRLNTCMRETDTLARFGGDEFVMVLTSLENEEDSLVSIHKIFTAIKEPLKLENHELQVTPSIGISIYPKSGSDADTLLKNADAAMYRAKDLGRNNFQFYTEELNTRAQRHLELGNNLYHALKQNEFVINYQPILDLNTGKIVGVEALTSWNNPHLGIISPAEFIKLAEESGQIFAIGEWILKTACQQNKTWHDEGLPKIYMSVNLSSYEIKQQDILTKIKKALDETQLDPKYLELELTENLMMDSTSQIISNLHKIKALGIALVIDDFGVGYSSLGFLSHFPITKIKIDREFTTALTIDATDTAVVLAIITLAKNLNMRILAEGVETKAQLEFLRAHHCEEAQGYYFSHPISAAECTKLLRENVNLMERKE